MQHAIAPLRIVTPEPSLGLGLKALVHQAPQLFLDGRCEWSMKRDANQLFGGHPHDFAEAGVAAGRLRLP